MPNGVAWDFAATHPVELVTINPGLVLGPLQRRQQATSMEAIRLLLARKLPAVPRLSFAVAGVRDIAAAHRLALSYYGVPVLVSADKAKQELGWVPRPARESIVAAGESLIRHGIVPRPRSSRPAAAR